MKRMSVITATLIGVAPLLFAETNAMIEDFTIRERRTQ